MPRCSRMPFLLFIDQRRAIRDSHRPSPWWMGGHRAASAAGASVCQRLSLISWNPIFTSGNPHAPSFLRARETLQDHSRWRETLEQMLTMWLSDAPASVEAHIRNEMESHGFEDWARAGREISAMYAREGDPLRALSELSPPVPVLHVFAEPRAPEYLSAQESFAREHSWFAVRRLESVSHFPTIEVPDETRWCD